MPAAVDKAEPVHFSENQEAGADGGREDSQRRSRPREHLEGVGRGPLSPGLAGAPVYSPVCGVPHLGRGDHTLRSSRSPQAGGHGAPAPL